MLVSLTSRLQEVTRVEHFSLFRSLLDVQAADSKIFFPSDSNPWAGVWSCLGCRAGVAPRACLEEGKGCRGSEATQLAGGAEGMPSWTGNSIMHSGGKEVNIT